MTMLLVNMSKDDRMRPLTSTILLHCYLKTNGMKKPLLTGLFSDCIRQHFTLPPFYVYRWGERERIFSVWKKVISLELISARFMLSIPAYFFR